MALLLASKHYGILTSPTQFFFYLVWLICGSATLYSIIRRRDDKAYNKDTTDRLLIFYATQFGLHFLLFLLNCFSDAEPIKYDERIKSLKNPCPQIKASFLSKLSYFWATPLIWKGFRNPLKTQDLWDMDPQITSRGVVPHFDANLNPIMEKSKFSQKVNFNHMSEGRRSGSLSLKTAEEIKAKSGFSVFPAMVKTFGPTFFVGGAMKIFYDALAMVSPQMMKLIIGFVETKVLPPTTNYTDSQGNVIIVYTEKEEEWKGYFYAVMILLVTMFQTVLLSQYFERMFIIGMNLRTSLISAIYRKSLRYELKSKCSNTSRYSQILPKCS